MKTVYLTAALILVPVFSAMAEGTSLTKDEQQIEVLRRQVASAQARVDVHVEKLMAKDGEIEAKINDVIKLLNSIKDSTESKTRITKVKKDIIDNLSKSIEFYRQRRRARIQKLKDERASFTAAESDKALAFLDNKIDKRIEQITFITSNMTQNREWKNSEKYEYVDDGYGNRIISGTSDKYTRHRKSLSSATQQRGKTEEILEKNRAEIERENARLEKLLKSARTEEGRAAVEAQIKKNNARLSKQAENENKMVNYARDTGKSLSRKDAFETDKWVEDMVKDINKDHREFMHMVSLGKNDAFTLSLWKERLNKAEAYVAGQKAAAEKASQAKPETE